LDLKDLTEAVHSLEVRSTDAAGNTSDVSKAQWTVDLTAPALTVSGAPKGTVSSKSATVSFTVDQADSVQCSIDDGAYTDCTSPIQLTDLADGSHKVAVKASDQAGNKALVVTDSWIVSTGKPGVPSLSGQPSASTTARDAVIAFTGASGAVFRCSVDGGSYADCASPVSLTGLGDGAHSLAVKQVDAAGTQSDAATAAWTVDTVAPISPSISFTGLLSGSTTSPSATFSYTVEAGATALCSLDGAPFTPCGASPATLNGIGFGVHTLTAKAVDAAGNVSDTTTGSWQVVVPTPRVLTPSAGTKTVVKKTVDGKSTWAIKVGQLFTNDRDARGSAQLLTVQVAVDAEGKPVSTKPSDSQPLPSAATFAQGVVAWDASGEVTRSSAAAPVWVRVGNRGGKWSGWVKLTQ
jgi:hypothetical protein